MYFNLVILTAFFHIVKAYKNSLIRQIAFLYFYYSKNIIPFFFKFQLLRFVKSFYNWKLLNIIIQKLFII